MTDPNTPVWHCTDDDCGGVWALEEQEDCPNCHAPSEPAGLTLGDTCTPIGPDAV